MLPKKKKSKVAEGTGSGHVDEKRVRAVSKIKFIQNELKKINVEEDNKVLEVLQEYSEIRRDIYTRRNKVLLSIEGFWLTVFFSHPALGEFLNAEDQKILHYLVSLDVDERPKLGYSITLTFSPNPYFENEKLTKTFSFPDQVTAVVTGAAIKWKEGLDKGLEDMSFFMWLSRTQQIPFSAASLDKVACIIKGCLWPDPLKYIIADKSLDGISEQNVDEEGAEFDADEGGQYDDEIDQEQEREEEGGEFDADEGGHYDDEIDKEQEGEEEGGEFDADEGGQYDDEIDQEQEGEEEGGEFDVNDGGQDDYELDQEQERDEEDGEVDTNDGGRDDCEIEEQEDDEEGGEVDPNEVGRDDCQIEEQEDDEEDGEVDPNEEQGGDEDDGEFDVEEGELDDDENMEQEDDEEGGQGDGEIEQEDDDEEDE